PPPPAVRADPLDGSVLVDNHINGPARAARAGGCALGVDDFVYVHLGEGLGCAVVTDAEVRRGHHGLAGEIAHLFTAGPRGVAMPFTEVFAELGLRRPGSTAIDADALRAAVLGDSATARRTRDALARAVGGVLAAAVALADPRLIVLGGAWGAEPVIAEAIRAHFAALPRSVPVEAARVPEPALAGARARAVEALRTAVITAPRPEASA
ncbi:ROK family protein, partial [Streptomyces prasinus]|uniref:ROK family protein n=1 Tax=Streptomyces prasinus TaxID=67345 RepID=UPI00362CA1B2